MTIRRTDKRFDPAVPCELLEVLDRQGHSSGDAVSIGPKDPYCVGLTVQPGEQMVAKRRGWGSGSVLGDCGLHDISIVVRNFQVLPI